MFSGIAKHPYPNKYSPRRSVSVFTYYFVGYYKIGDFKKHKIKAKR
ncbi:hypothetical protein HMPREF1320_0882 [Capnocytophaga sp. oral taxon 335 str. F0486]|nr:hypothetical protein HMPREF1320_0882 [Capnocytophaga sp. oral taxon 335 str. F0486]